MKACSKIEDALAQFPADLKAGFGDKTGPESSCRKPSHCLPTTSHAADQTTGQIQANGTVSHLLVLPVKYSETLTERNSTEV